MQVLHLDNLPDFAQRELLDFYQFLVEKYAIPHAVVGIGLERLVW